MVAGSIEKPEDVFNFGLAHEEQVKLVQSCQETLLKEQITLIESVVESCPNCPDRKLVKYGKRRSDYHDVFTDHKLTIGKEESWSMYQQHWEQQLTLLATEVQQGYCEPKPKRGSICQQCSFQSLCRLD